MEHNLNMQTSETTNHQREIINIYLKQDIITTTYLGRKTKRESKTIVLKHNYNGCKRKALTLTLIVVVGLFRYERSKFENKELFSST